MNNIKGQKLRSLKTWRWAMINHSCYTILLSGKKTRLRRKHYVKGGNFLSLCFKRELTLFLHITFPQIRYLVFWKGRMRTKIFQLWIHREGIEPDLQMTRPPLTAQVKATVLILRRTQMIHEVHDPDDPWSQLTPSALSEYNCYYCCWAVGFKL